MITGLAVQPKPSRRALRYAWIAGRFLLVGAFSGALAGLVAGGIGSRVAMRIVALAAGKRFYGMQTEAGEIVGRITFEGSFFLVSASAIFSIPFGVTYLAMRPTLPGPAHFTRGLTYGLVLFAIFGATIIDDSNFDFTLFTSPYLAVGLFAALFPLFGFITGWTAERLAPAPSVRPARQVIATVWLLAAIPIFLGAFHLVQSLRNIFT